MANLTFLDSEPTFANVKDFSMELKNTIAIPMLIKLQRSHGLEPFTILSLPDEILVQIAEHLADVSSIKAFKETCVKFKQITTHQLLWKRLFQRFFPKQFEECQNVSDWHQIFKVEYKKTQRNSSRTEATIHMPYFGIDDFPLLPPLHWLHFLDI